MQILKSGFLSDKDGSSFSLRVNRPDLITESQKPANALREF